MCLWITRKKCRDREIDRELAELQLRMAKLEDRDKSNSVERKLADLVSVRYEYEVVYGCLTNYTPRRKQLKDKGWTLVGYIKESDAEVWINSKELINA